MPDDRDAVPDEPLPPSSVELPPRQHRRHRRWPWVVAAIVILPIALLALWTAIALNYSYSNGNRAGYVQKFSRKGWLCKTYEGQLAMVNVPGAMQERWDFSVRNDSIAHPVTKSMGQRVSLTYDQHAGVPTSCFGETQYFVTGVQLLGQ
jgi:alpha-ketoglutarate-dependent taurine dioxygenase